MFFGSKLRCRQCGSKEFSYQTQSGLPKCANCGAFVYGPQVARWRDRRPLKLIGLFAVAFLVGVAGAVWWVQKGSSSETDCLIKGNISRASGERIYHVPGGQYYSRTKITTSKGERWFCSEPEARAAGWRRSKR